MEGLQKKFKVAELFLNEDRIKKLRIFSLDKNSSGERATETYKIMVCRSEWGIAIHYFLPLRTMDLK